MLERHAAQIGRWAWVMAWVGLVVGQVHALARFATEDGQEDLAMASVRWWAEPAADVLSPLLEWGDADLVYVSWGKVWFPVFLAFTLCAALVGQRRQPAGVEKWAWRVVVLGYAVATTAVFLDYWTQWTGSYEGGGLEESLFTLGWYFTVPGLLLTLLGSTFLGVVLLVKRFRPVVPALLLALVVPLAFGILSVTSMGSAALPVMFAFGLLGRRIARAEHGVVTGARTSAGGPAEGPVGEPAAGRR
jgi:hypothetical protein